MLWVLKRTVSIRWVFFEHPKHMFKLMGKKIIPNLPSKNLLDWTYGPKVSTHAPYEAEGVIFKDSSNFMACGIQCRACNLSEISMTCKAHFKAYQFSYLVYVAGMYRIEVIRRRKKMCVLQVTPPTLHFYPLP